MKKRVAGKLGSTKQARSRTRRRFVASLPETIPVFSSTLRFPFLFFLFFHHHVHFDREGGTMGPAFIESYIIDNRENDSQIRYIGDDSSISFSPRSLGSNVTLAFVPLPSLCSPGERTVSSGSDAFRAFSFCLPFFRLPRDASQFPLNRRRRRLLIRSFIRLSPSPVRSTTKKAVGRAFKEIPICRITTLKRTTRSVLDFYARDNGSTRLSYPL